MSADAVLAPSLPEARLKMEQIGNCDGVTYLRDGNNHTDREHIARCHLSLDIGVNSGTYAHPTLLTHREQVVLSLILISSLSWPPTREQRDSKVA